MRSALPTEVPPNFITTSGFFSFAAPFVDAKLSPTASLPCGAIQIRPPGGPGTRRLTPGRLANRARRRRGSGIGDLGGFANDVDKNFGGKRKIAVATVNQPQLPVKLLAIERNQFQHAGRDVRLAIGPADQGNAQTRAHKLLDGLHADRKSTRLNSSHLVISYAVFCLKKKKKDYSATL